MIAQHAVYNVALKSYLTLSSMKSIQLGLLCIEIIIDKDNSFITHKLMIAAFIIQADSQKRMPFYLQMDNIITKKSK